MASNPTKPSRGRPRRKGETRHILFKASTYETWKEKKDRMGLSNLNNSEFAELLLHRVDNEEPDQLPASRHKRKRIVEPSKSRKQLWSTPGSTCGVLSSPTVITAISPIMEQTSGSINIDVTGRSITLPSTSVSEVNIDITGQSLTPPSASQPLTLRSANIELANTISSQPQVNLSRTVTEVLRSRINPLYGSLEGDPFQNSESDFLSSASNESDEGSEVEHDSDDAKYDVTSLVSECLLSENEIDDDDSDYEDNEEYRSEEDEISLPDDSATLTALTIDVDGTFHESVQQHETQEPSTLHVHATQQQSQPIQEQTSSPNQQQPAEIIHQQQSEAQQFGPKTESQVYAELSKLLQAKFSRLSEVDVDADEYADKVELQRVVTEVTQIENLFNGKCENANCQEKRHITHRTLENGVLTISYFCPHGHGGVWSSSSLLTQKRGQNVYVTSVLLSAGVLITGNNFDKISSLFTFMNCSLVSKTTFNRIQTLYAIPVIRDLWKAMKEKVESVFQEETITLSGDGRMDSPGFSAKYCVYTIMELQLNAILDLEVVDKREAGGTSTVMEKMALKRLIERLLRKFLIAELTTDASATIIKLIRELKNMHQDELGQLFHSLDIWHKSCKLTAKLTKACKVKGNEAIKQWIEPIRNHFWHCAEISHGSEETLKDTWIGVIHHICGEHVWADGSCSHGPLTNLESGKTFLSKDFKPFKAVQEIVFLPKWLASLKYYVFFRHTSNLESFNSMMLKYAPKRNAFSNEVFSARVELAALDHNFHLFREVIPARGKKTYSKRSKNWKVQQVKEKKAYQYWLKLASNILKARVDDNKAVSRHIEVAASHPRNIAPSIAMKEAPPTKELLDAKLSRFQRKS